MEKNEILEETPVKEINLAPDTLSEYDHKRIDKDIKYRGPLSYRYLRLIGWICMSIMFVSMMLGVATMIKGAIGTVDPGRQATVERISGILSLFSALPLPLFLMANFAIILQQKNNYKKLILGYLKILLAIYVGFIVIYYHFVVVLLMRVENMSFLDARLASIEIFTALGKQNGLVVNVFIDLFCCVLIMYFIDYTPKKYFQGKKIILFRLLVLLPVLYEVGSAILMGLLGMNSIYTDFKFSLPPEILPLIGKKPIGMIFAFLFICIYIKLRQRHYMKKGGTQEGYELYQKTNRNSLRFSALMAITFAVVAILDFIAILVPAVALIGNNPDASNTENIINVLSNFTLGKSICLILVIPFVLLFSYTKQHNNEKLDKFVPFIGIGLVVVAIVETLFFTTLF